MKKILMAAGAAIFALGTAVSASTLSIVGGTDTFIPGGLEGVEGSTPRNNVLDAYTGVTDKSIEGYQGANIVLNRNARLRVEVIGWEVGGSQYNKFTIDGTTVGRDVGEDNHTFPTIGGIIEDFYTGLLTAGVLGFDFTSEDAIGTPRGGVSNGSNALAGKNFFASFADPLTDIGGTKRTGNVLWLFYDDGGVANDNHDDLVIRISAVPLPAGALLLISGLGVMAMRRRKTA